MELKQILVVDDNPSVVALIKAYLKIAEFDPQCFTTKEAGKQAISWIQSGGRPSAAILDLRINSVNGIDVYHSLVQNSPKTLPVFLTAADVSDPMYAEAQATGHLILRKPAKIGLLADWIRRQLQIQCNATKPSDCIFLLKPGDGLSKSCTECIEHPINNKESQK